MAFTDDYAGQGGSYLLDPETGVRTLVERTEEAQPVSAAVETAEADQPVTETNPEG